MIKREKLAKKSESLYFENEDSDVTYFSSGCTLLDCVLGGGWAKNRIINVIGDKSTAKTGLFIEAACNFLNKYKGQSVVKYAEAEAAFDKNYAKKLGLPIDQLVFEEDIFTVEDFFKAITASCEDSLKSKTPCLYVLDSLDALSDEAEMERDIGEGTYGASKAKLMSQLFRRCVKIVKKSNTTVFIISQIRDTIGMTFGKKYSRSGGHALDFYASQIVYLSHMKTIIKTIDNIERPIGIHVKVKCTKNKAGLPFRECEFDYIFNYGIDDLKANLDWVHSNNFLVEYGEETKQKYLNKLNKMSDDDFYKESDKLSAFVKTKWAAIEDKFKPERSKY